MKKLLLFFSMVALTITGCQKYDDGKLWNSVNGLEDRVSKLERLCGEMNTNISALQTIVNALQTNDYVTGVTPIMQGGKEVGYTITFTKSSPITIYHGKDGKNGTDGKDGQNGQDGKDGITPVIGVRQDVDGIYYWTLNGEWLQDAAGNKIKAQGIDGKNGADGKDGAAGSDGKDGAAGTDGKDGQDGTDGITPQLKIENDYWYISYDNGSTWTQLGRATGATGVTGDKGDKGDQGNKGDKGEQGDSMFSDIDYSDTDCVVFTLSNGTQIKLPTWSAFETLRTLCNQMNTNIAALQTMVNALQNNDYVTGVTPIVQDGQEIGYTIKFSKSNAITIYHGKDGKNGTDGKDGQNGQDGKDGSTPIIGVKQDTDGIYYWTLNGEWLQDVAGNKIKAQGIDGKNGADGKDGATGSDGKDGADGITPQLKIDGGYWYVSYDNGASWIQLGKATGDKGDKGDQGDKGDAGNQGDKGDKGEQGDSMFSDVDYSNSDYVIITLADGTQIQLPTWSAFVALRTLCNQMNTNITALQTIVNALQNNDYVVGVTPLTQNGKEVGYTIRFSKSGTVVIYHGKDGQNGSDGKDGENGKDGTTPEIGVKKASDDIYYWTLNGEWLQDAAGNKIKAQGVDGKNGTDGKDGATGSDGKDGANGITPQLKIDGGYWYISYDNGTSWTKLGQATGDKGDKGDQGDKGDAGLVGDSMFTDVDYSNGEYVIFTLSNGTQIQLPTWSAFVSLRVLCNQLNTNIASLQTIVNALQNNDYVTSVAPVTRNGKEVGYTITFSKSNAITIYHGKDGQNGQDGKDGQNGTTPVIGVNQYTDGVYYWTLNGDWLKDAKGNKIRAQGIDGKNGADGKDGATGSDGKDGANGITPQLKIDGGYWYISYDNGTSWTKLGQATGDKGDKGDQGNKGDKGEQGDSMFSNIDYSDADYVIFILSNGTQIKLPTWSAFESLRTLCNQMNTNISSLQAIVDALQNNDYVKSVTPVMQDGKEVGYTITFSKSNPITIYHGKNGSNGKDGANGTTPIIGVQKDTDNIYYWTLDGEWLKDSNGNKIKAQGIDGKNGADGKDGAAGSDGKDGTNGITPQLKIDSGYWYISYDNGTSWTKLGQATGDKGDQGNKGDSMFESVTQDANNVYLKLTDGTTIALPKYKGLTVEFSQRNDIAIRLGKSATVTYKINDGGTNPEIEVMTYDGWTADVIKTDSAKGSITFTCPAEATATKKAIVFVSDSNGRTTMTTLTFAYAYPVIYYTSTDGNIITPSISEVVSNIYKDGQGILTIKDEDYVGDMTMFKGKTTLKSIAIPTCVTAIGKSAFNGCAGLVNIAIPDTVTSIGESAFNGCAGLVNIAIPDTVTSIGESAFNGCAGLVNITIPDTVTSIGEFAFYGCTGLTSIIIPDGITSIGIYTFCNCSNLTSVTIPKSVMSISESAFVGCTGKLYINCNIPDGKYQNGKHNGCFIGSKFTEIIIGNGVKTIGSNAFCKCKDIVSVVIPNSITSIGEYAFMGCTSLISVHITDLAAWCAIKFSYGGNPLSNNTHSLYLNGKQIADLVVPDGVSEICDYVFEDCTCQTVAIPNSVTSVGYYAFADCKELTDIVIGNGITSIDSYALSNCIKLKTVYCKSATPPSLGKNVFKYYSSSWTNISCKIYVPRESLDAYKSAVGWRDYASNIEGYDF